jgi:hypothetical protein
MLERLDDEERADWRAGREAAYQLATLTVGGAWQSTTDKRRQRKPGGEAGVSEGTIGIWGNFDHHRRERGLIGDRSVPEPRASVRAAAGGEAFGVERPVRRGFHKDPSAARVVFFDLSEQPGLNYGEP